MANASLEKLKHDIETASFDMKSKIFVYSDTTFLPYQYIREMIERKNLTVVFVDGLSKIPTETFEPDLQTLYILNTDEFTSSLNGFSNVIVVCKKTNQTDNVYNFPKLVDWQIQDYMSVLVPGLSQSQRGWLYQLTKSDVYRVINECKKISIFSKDKQADIFKLINEDNGYSDLSNYTIFDLTNAVMKKDLSTISRIFQERSAIDVDGPGIAVILLNQFIKLSQIQLNPKATYENTGMSYGQFRAIASNKGIYEDRKLIDNIIFLSGIDSKIKSGYLDPASENFVYYIVDSVLC